MPLLTLSKHKLCQFLILAKQNTFAKNATRSPSKSLFSKNYIFEEDEFSYEDQYFGEYVDVGEEIVWFNGVPVWGMGYRGGVHAEFMAEREQAFSLLKKALLLPEKDFPVRGPQFLKDEGYSYHNYAKGNIFEFIGQEYIYRDKIEVCFRRYVGGLILGKNNKNMIITD
jgi:hypothetical protein